MKAIVIGGVVLAITEDAVLTDTAIETPDVGNFQGDLSKFSIIEITEDTGFPEVGDEHNKVEGKFNKAKTVRKAELQEAADNIQTLISSIERDTILNRGSREFELLVMEQLIAPQMAKAKGVTVTQVLEASIYYQKLKVLDTQIATHRAEMATLWAQINSF